MVSSPPVGGRLSAFVSAWQNITSDESILNHINGISLDFIEDPYSVRSYVTHFRSPTEEANFHGELLKLLDKQVIELCDPQPDQILSKVFLIPKPDGSFRTIFDMKPLNQIIRYVHFKMDTLQTALSLLRPNSWVASIDLKDAYFTLPVAEKFRKYLRFQFQSQTYQFLAMPQGLCSAPLFFTKVMKPVMASLRQEGLVCMNYLDDLLFVAPTSEACKVAVDRAKTFLTTLGFILNVEKSQFEPVKSLTYLGFVLDTTTMKVTLPRSKGSNCLVERYCNSHQCLFLN